MAAQPDCDVLTPGPLVARGRRPTVVAERLGEPADDASSTTCLKVSGGNAFYLRELLRPFEVDLRAGSSSARRPTAPCRCGGRCRGGWASSVADATSSGAGSCRPRRRLLTAGRRPSWPSSTRPSRVREAARLEVGQHPGPRRSRRVPAPAAAGRGRGGAARRGARGAARARGAAPLVRRRSDPASVAQHLLASPGRGRRRGVGVPLRAGSAPHSRPARSRLRPAPAAARSRRARTGPSSASILLWLGRAEHPALDLDAAREHLEDGLRVDAIGGGAGRRRGPLRRTRRRQTCTPSSAAHPRARAGRWIRSVTPRAEVHLRALPVRHRDHGCEPGLAGAPSRARRADAEFSVDRSGCRPPSGRVGRRPRTHRHGGTTEQFMANLRRVDRRPARSPGRLDRLGRPRRSRGRDLPRRRRPRRANASSDSLAPAAARLAGVRPAGAGRARPPPDRPRPVSRGAFEDALAQIAAAEDFTGRHVVVPATTASTDSRGDGIALERGDYAMAAVQLKERIGEDLVYPALGALLSGDPTRAAADAGRAGALVRRRGPAAPDRGGAPTTSRWPAMSTTPRRPRTCGPPRPAVSSRSGVATAHPP